MEPKKDSADTKRLDWLSINSYAFVLDHKTGKGFIRLSAEYQNIEPFDLRKSIDKAMAWKDESKSNL